ncbi:Uncharacterised protein [Mycobacteroides abscessus subsp. abscessus]|nr:Uncharacterised protein [Mycobacteroides abscessus subsp. abscessus]
MSGNFSRRSANATQLPALLRETPNCKETSARPSFSACSITEPHTLVSDRPARCSRYTRSASAAPARTVRASCLRDSRNNSRPVSVSSSRDMDLIVATSASGSVNVNTLDI